MRRWMVPVMVVVLVGACGDGSGSESSTRVTAGAETTTTTTAPASSTTEAAPEVWDLVYFSDSGGWGVAYPYAELASEALGREVRVHDHAIGGLAAVSLREMVKGSLAEEVAEAEIIVVYGNPADSGVELPQPDIGTCVSTSTTEREPPVLTTMEDWQPYREVLDEIYTEIWSLREGQPTVLRAVDLYVPVLAPWRQAGIEAECTANWEVWSGVIREAAKAHGATMVSTFDLFNGATHDDDAREKGWIGPDGEHTTAEGAQAIAEALHAAGYELSTGPG